jgi:hypothetical protein
MVYAMDTLGYAKRLRDAGVPQQQAEAHAEAARDFVMGELVTKTDLQSATHLLEVKIGADLQAAVQLSKGKSRPSKRTCRQPSSFWRRKSKPSKRDSRRKSTPRRCA